MVSNTITLSQYRNYFDVLLGCWGEETKLADINAKLVNQFMDALPHYPRNKNKELKDKTFQELIEMDLASNKCISKKTQKDYINAIKTFFNWCVNRGHSENNWFEGRTISIQYHEQAHTSGFNAIQLNRIFTENSAFTSSRVKTTFRLLQPTQGPDEQK